MQYVCETAQKVNERFNEIRTGFKQLYIYMKFIKLFLAISMKVTAK